MKFGPISGVVVLSLASVSGAQTSPAFLTGAHDFGPISRVHGGVLTHQVKIDASSHVMAVANGKVLLGGSKPNQVFPVLNADDLSETGAFTTSAFKEDGATSDGTKIYYIQAGTNYIMSCDLDWTNSKYLFKNPYGFGYDLGYDSSDNTLWGMTEGKYYHMDMNGQGLGTFWAAGAAYGIGVDNADGTIWMTHFPTQTIVQYDKLGNKTGLSHKIDLNWNGDYGIEFNNNAVPAPASAALLCLGGLAASRRRR